jgi:hypothetical protein
MAQSNFARAALPHQNTADEEQHHAANGQRWNQGVDPSDDRSKLVRVYRLGQLPEQSRIEAGKEKAVLSC